MRSRSIAIEVTRNIEMNGKMPEQRPADAVERAAGARRRRTCSSVSSTDGTTSSSASVRGSRRSCASTRAAVASVTRARSCAAPCSPTRRRNASSRSRAPVRSQQLVRRAVGEQSPVAHQQERSQRSASSITWLETRSVAPPAASRWNSAQRSRRRTGSSPTVGSSRTSSVRLAEQRGGERDARRWPPGERARRRVSANSPRSTSASARRRPPPPARRGCARSSAGSRARSGRRRPTGACVT